MPLEVVGSTDKKTAASPVTCCYGEDIHVMGGTEREFKQLTTSLANRARSYARRGCKAMVSSCQEVKVHIEMNEEQLEEVRSFKYSGAIIYTERTSYEKNQSSDIKDYNKHDKTKTDQENSHRFHSNSDNATLKSFAGHTDMATKA